MNRWSLHRTNCSRVFAAGCASPLSRRSVELTTAGVTVQECGAPGARTMNPQMSAPTKGAPIALNRTVVVIEIRRSCHVAALSPVQCAVTRPEPENVDLRTQATLTLHGQPQSKACMHTGPQQMRSIRHHMRLEPCQARMDQLRATVPAGQSTRSGHVFVLVDTAGARPHLLSTNGRCRVMAATAEAVAMPSERP